MDKFNNCHDFHWEFMYSICFFCCFYGICSNIDMFHSNICDLCITSSETYNVYFYGRFRHIRTVTVNYIYVDQKVCNFCSDTHDILFKYIVCGFCAVLTMISHKMCKKIRNRAWISFYFYSDISEACKENHEEIIKITKGQSE